MSRMDRLTKNQRSFCMSQNRGKDTKPEIIVRKLIYSLGYRYRLHRRDLPGCPDIVFGPRKKVIFVNGCYWHRHSCKKGRSIPETRKKFWQTKLQGNKERDLQNRRKLTKLGWKTLTVWECQIKDFEKVTARIINFLE